MPSPSRGRSGSLARERRGTAGTWWCSGRGSIWGREHAYLYGLGQQLGSVHLVFGPNARLPLTHVENCADLFATCVDAPAASGRTYNVVDGDEVRIWRYLGDHLRLSRQAGLRIPIPYALGFGTARLAQATSRWIFRGKGKLPGVLVPCRFQARFKPLRFPSERARRELGWRPPFSYQACLERTYGPPPPAPAPRPERPQPANGALTSHPVTGPAPVRLSGTAAAS